MASISLSKKPLDLQITSGMVSGIIVVVLCAALGYSFYAGWQALQGPREASGLSVVATPGPSPVVKLKISQDDRKSAPDTTINPDTLGKENPFKR